MDPITRLVILKQNCLAEEIIQNKDDESISVHVVVKHSPFVVQLGLDNGSPHASATLDLKCLSFETRLFYDSEENKEVDFIKLKPLEYKVKVDESGLFVNIECRLKVLTSQLEDMFFRLHFIALEPITKRQLGPNFIAVSAPIKVISKPEQLRKSLPTVVCHKRKFNEEVYQVVERIENQQMSQRQLLDQLEHNLSFMIVERRILAQNQAQPQVEPPKVEDLETCFQKLMTCFETMNPDSRGKKMRMAIQRSNISSEYASQFIDLFTAQGLRKPIGTEVSASNSFLQPFEDECHCENCPHRAELQRIEEFYKTFSL